MAEQNSSGKGSKDQFAKQINRKAKRKAKVNRQPDPPFWSSFSLFGVVGWSVAIPTVLAVAVGIWLDRRIQDQHSWTLVMIPIGLVIGCAIAWHWISHEQRQIEKDEREDE